MKNLCTILLLIILNDSGLCQVTGDRINYILQVHTVNYYNNSNEGNNNPEPAWKFSTGTTSAANNILINECITALDETTHNVNRLIATGQNDNASRIVYWKAEGWENDDTNSSRYCEYDSGDDECHTDNGSITARFGDPGLYRYGSNIGMGSSEWKPRVLWGYFNGQWEENSALSFGVLQPGDNKSHSNTTYGTAYGVLVYGRKNTFKPGASNVLGAPAQNSNDAYYQFEITDNPQKVHIETSVATYSHYIHLIHEDSEGIKTHVTSVSGSDPNIIEVLPTGTYYIIFEGTGSTNGAFKLHVSSIEPELTAGSIVNNSPYVKDGCSITQGISNVNSATTTYDTFTYSWYKKINDNNPTWEVIPGASNEHLTAQELDTLSGENVYIKRRASQLGVEVETESVLITIKQPGDGGYNGSISGKVTGKDKIGSIGDVRIILTSNAKGECVNFSDTTYSNPNNGSYSFGNLYYEDNLVGAEFLDHGFKPDTFNITINNGVTNDNNTNITFEDTTSIFVNGSIYQVDENLDTCGIPDISFYLNDILQTTTESNELGEYSLVITQRDNDNLYNVRPDSSLYKFDPIDINDVFVVQDVSNLDFENTRRDTIRGSVTACGGFYFGSVELLFEDLNGGCFRYTIETDSTGNYEIVVPARSYTIRVDTVTTEPNSLPDGYSNEDIMDYFRYIVDTVDVTTSSAVSNFLFRQAPTLSIDYLPTNSCGDMTDTVFYEGVPVNIVFNVVEQNTGNCPLDTGRLVIQDNISGRSENIELAIKDGRALYEIFPGQPLLVDDHKKSFTAMDVENTNNIDVVSFRAIIDENVPQSVVEQTVSPDIPMLILRDPPGDNSFSYFQKDSTTTFSSVFQSLRGGEVKVWQNVEAGIKIQTGIGVSTSFAATVSQSGSLTLATLVGSRNENISSLRVAEQFQTSSDDAIGAEADVFVGGAFNISYGITDIIEYDTETCTINKDSSLVMSPDSLATTFAYTAKTIRGVLIPRFEQLKDLSSDIAEKNRYENQISVWTQMLDRNDDLKEEAISTGSTYTFGGDLSWEESTTESSTDKSFFEFDLNINREITASAKLETAAVDIEGGVNAKFRYYIGTGFGGITEGTQKKETTERELEYKQSIAISE